LGGPKDAGCSMGDSPAEPVAAVPAARPRLRERGIPNRKPVMAPRARHANDHIMATALVDGLDAP